MTAPFAISAEDVSEAARRIAPHIYQTPIVPSERLSSRLNCDLYFKAENLQHVGAFKARGAMNAVLVLDDTAAHRGVVTHSSGNHGAALARAAARRKVTAHVVMPANSAPNKIEAVRAYGVEPVFCEPSAESRHETAERLRQETGATMIHPYDSPTVMAGQGTVASEILQQLADVDVIFVPVGGGGLLSGILTWAKSSRPEVKIIAVEPERADDAARSLRSGRIELPTRYDTIADGLRTPLGHNTFPIISHLLDHILLVSEEAIRQATRMLADDVRLVAEPSGATPLAGLLTATKDASRRTLIEDKRVVAVVSGGNVNPEVS